MKDRHREEKRVCVPSLSVPEGAETVELYDWFPGTTQPCALGKMSGGRRRWRRAHNVSNCDSNYRVGICDRNKDVTYILLEQSAVIIFHKDRK